MQCMQDRQNVGKILLSPLKSPPKEQVEANGTTELARSPEAARVEENVSEALHAS